MAGNSCQKMSSDLIVKMFCFHAWLVVLVLATGDAPKGEVFDIRFATADESGAGSDTGAALTIYGTERNVDNLVLFEPGTPINRKSMNHIVFNTNLPIGNVTMIEAEALGNDGWLIEWIAISERRTKTLWYFFCDRNLIVCKIDIESNKPTSLKLNTTTYHVGCFEKGDIFDIAYHTDDFDGGGDSSDAVLISFYGSDGNATDLILKQDGSFDDENTLGLRYVIPSIKIGNLTTLHLKNTGYDGWTLGQIHVVERGSGSSWRYDCHCDLDRSSGHEEAATMTPFESAYKETNKQVVDSLSRGSVQRKMDGYKIPMPYLPIAIERVPCEGLFCASQCGQSDCTVYHLMRNASQDQCLCEVFQTDSPLQEWQLDADPSAQTWVTECV